jgi:hypothetical protein
MRALSAVELLDVWERGFAQSPAQRALLLLAVASGETGLERLTQFSAGQRDAHLLALREQTFGSRLASVTVCPACAEQLQFQLNAADMRATPTTNVQANLKLTQAKYDVEFRLPNGLDLASLDPEASLQANRQSLLQRCVITARRAGREIEAAQLPAEVAAALARRMAEADPQADVLLALTCPQCRHAWQAPFDIVSYLWAEINAWAARLLREVNWLASAYGWSESEVIALSPWRRQAYLELIEP